MRNAARAAGIPSAMLVLFDIDGTLYHGDGTGRAAFIDAGRELFGDRFLDHRFDLSGRLDPWIFGRFMELSGLELTPEIDATFRDACHRHLRRRIESGRHNVRSLPGTLELVERLGKAPGVTIGLLTGNWEPNGRLKVDSVGFDSRQFRICAWGDDGPTRNDLPPVARQRYVDTFSRDIEFEQVVIVGDTIHDVACAAAHNCRCLAVCTGGCTEAQLRQAGATTIMTDLSDCNAVLGWLLDSRQAVPS